MLMVFLTKVLVRLQALVDRSKNVFSLCFLGTISRCISTCEGEKSRHRYNAAVHYSVGMLFVPGRKFGVAAGFITSRTRFNAQTVPQGTTAHTLPLVEQKSN
jgi:hypothetical protein